jgi:RNA polymerase sigma-70 factor (ECF subfamily)
VAQNKIVDAYRHTQKQQHLPLEEAANCTNDEYTLPETVALRQEQLTQLCLHLSKLPALQQLVIRLRFTYDLSHREIADQIGKREAAVRVLIHRTLKQLRTH